MLDVAIILLCCHCLLLISTSCDVPERLCFVIVAFPGFLLLLPHPHPCPTKTALGGYCFQVVCLSVTFKFLSRGVENGAGWGGEGGAAGI